MQPVFALQPAPAHCVTRIHVPRARLSAWSLRKSASEVLFPVQGVRGQLQAGDVEPPDRVQPNGPAGEQGDAERRTSWLRRYFHA